MINSSCKCVIDLPTRITPHSKTLLDHTYVSDNTKHFYTSGVLLTDLSDHFGTFIAVAEKKCHINKPKVVQIRDMSKFDVELFLHELEQHLRDAELGNNNSAQSWTALFRAFSTHRQPSASLTNLFPSWTRLLAELDKPKGIAQEH